MLRHRFEHYGGRRKTHAGTVAETLEFRAVAMTNNRIEDASVLPDLLA